MKSPVVADLDAATCQVLPCCGVKNKTHEGRQLKTCWLLKHFKRGLRAKVLLTPDNRQCGYIEYLPGQYAWRAVEAEGYMFIHCIWTWLRQYQHKGLAGSLLQACLDDAKSKGMKGVAVVARDRPWLAGSAVFLANGFEVVDTAPPDYQLLVKKLDPSAGNPRFNDDWEVKLQKCGRGLIIIRSDQCPHTAKFAREIEESARNEYGLNPKVIRLRSHKDAQNAPTPYAIFAIIYNGRLLADHPISRTRFRNIMKTIKVSRRPVSFPDP
jgi:hypothetical protein